MIERDKRLAEIRARLANVSGRWVSDASVVYVVEAEETPSRDEIRSLFVDVGASDVATFLAHTPEDLTFLLAEVERLSARHDAWKTFMDVGLLWFVNRSLHLFGWAIVLETLPDGSVVGAYPQRVQYRGFDRETEEARFADLTSYLAGVVPELEKEAKS